MSSYIVPCDIGESASPIRISEAPLGGEKPGKPFSWEETLSQPEDPFFAIESISKTGEGYLIDINPDHREDFERLLQRAVTGAATNEQT